MNKPSTRSIMYQNWLAIVGAVFFAALLTASPSFADQNASLFTPVQDYFSNWFVRVEATHAEQPHWITPVATVTPLLEQEYRYDQVWLSQPHGLATDHYGSNKGIELIPTKHIELIFGIPGYITRTRPRDKNGFADQTFLIKYRLLSANQDNGNYVLSVFMGFSAPTADRNENSAGHAVFIPTIAFGKGWGNFDVQSTLAMSFPNGGVKRLGEPITYNAAFQYRIHGIYWPEIEFNYTYWPNGERASITHNQLFITPGIVVGKIPLAGPVGLTLAAGMQIAATDNPVSNHNFILSARLPF